MNDPLTTQKEGSIKELWTIAYPMILAFLSANIMMFADRLFLANYSLAAMNASAAAGIMIAVFLNGTAIITSIAEVFVGQYNGAKEYRRVAAPTWQMLWFSAVLLIPFFALAEWGGPYLLPEYHYADHGLPYYQWLLYFGATTPAIAALSGFFVGIGKTRYIMAITIIGNLLNVGLDLLLIFGIKNVIEPMGTKGAAIATGLSQVAQVIVFGLIFLSHSYRKKYGTTLWRLQIPLFLRCLKVGVPNAIGHMIEWTAWALTIRMMATIGEQYLTVAAIGQSIYMLIAFGFEGVQKAVTALAANRIGEGNYDCIWSVWRSAIKLLFISAVPFGVIMLGYPYPLIEQFLSTETPSATVAELTPLLRITAAGVFLYYLVDGFTWLSVGVLTAAEDTWFVMWVNGMTAWVCGLMPIFLFMVYLNWSPAFYYMLISFYGTCNAVIFYRRLHTKPWEKLKVNGFC